MSVKTEGFIKGSVTHRRTETDYMSTLLDVVTLEDWREVVQAALTAAKAGNAVARNWLAQYLVGKSGTAAQSPIEIVAHQISGKDPLVAAIAQPHIAAARYPALAKGDEFEEYMQILVAGELLEAVEEEQRRAKAKARRAKKRERAADQEPDSEG